MWVVGPRRRWGEEVKRVGWCDEAGEKEGGVRGEGRSVCGRPAMNGTRVEMESKRRLVRVGMRGGMGGEKLSNARRDDELDSKKSGRTKRRGSRGAEQERSRIRGWIDVKEWVSEVECVWVE